MQSIGFSSEIIFSVYAVVIPVRPLFATSSLAHQTAGTHSDTAIGTALPRACGASCIRPCESHSARGWSRAHHGPCRWRPHEDEVLYGSVHGDARQFRGVHGQDLVWKSTI